MSVLQHAIYLSIFNHPVVERQPNYVVYQNGFPKSRCRTLLRVLLQSLRICFVRSTSQCLYRTFILTLVSKYKNRLTSGLFF